MAEALTPMSLPRRLGSLFQTPINAIRRQLVLASERRIGGSTESLVELVDEGKRHDSSPAVVEKTQSQLPGISEGAEQDGVRSHAGSMKEQRSSSAECHAYSLKAPSQLSAKSRRLSLRRTTRSWSSPGAHQQARRLAPPPGDCLLPVPDRQQPTKDTVTIAAADQEPTKKKGRPKKKKDSQHHDAITKAKQQYCVTGCRHGRAETTKAQLVRCGVCMHWLHPTCVGDSMQDAEQQGAWTCHQCRRLSTDVATIMSEVRQLRTLVVGIEEMRSSLKNLQVNNTDLVKQVAAKTAQVDELRHQNEGLRERLKKAENSKPAPEMPAEKLSPPQKTPSSDLLIGDSLLRDVNHSDLPENCKVKTLRGATIADIEAHLHNNNIHADTITIVAGTNDCASATDLPVIVGNFKSLVEEAFDCANRVVISSVPPVLDNSKRQELTDCVNAALVGVCDETGAVFKNQDQKFRLADSTVNDLLLSRDGVHLSQAGTTRLLQNLELLSPTRLSTHMPAAHRNDANRRNTRLQGSSSRTATEVWRAADHKQHHSQKESGAAKHQVNGAAVRRHRPSGQTDRYSSQQQQPLCHNCGKTGHLKKDCHHTRPVRCYNCQKLGHKSNDCYKR